MKTWGGGGMASCIRDISTRRRGVVYLMTWLLYPPDRRLAGKVTPLPGIEPQFPGHPVYNLVTGWGIGMDTWENLLCIITDWRVTAEHKYGEHLLWIITQFRLSDSSHLLFTGSSSNLRPFCLSHVQQLPCLVIIAKVRSFNWSDWWS